MQNYYYSKWFCFLCSLASDSVFCAVRVFIARREFEIKYATDKWEQNRVKRVIHAQSTKKTNGVYYVAGLKTERAEYSSSDR